MHANILPRTFSAGTPHDVASSASGSLSPSRLTRPKKSFAARAALDARFLDDSVESPFGARFRHADSSAMPTARLLAPRRMMVVLPIAPHAPAAGANVFGWSFTSRS